MVRTPIVPTPLNLSTVGEGTRIKASKELHL